MIKNYLKIALRNIKRHKGFAFLNIFGLSVGLAACLLLFIVIRYENSYDKFLPEHESVYHIATQDKTADGLFHTPGIPFPALDAVRLDIPQVTTGALYASYGSQISVLGKTPNDPATKKFMEGSGIFYADPEFFKIFQYKWLQGTPEVLKEPNVTVLSQKAAEKYFGSWKDAIGQYIRMDNAIDYKVSGILENPPANTDFPLAVVHSLITSRNNARATQYSTDWGSTTSNFQLYMKLPAGVSQAAVNRQLQIFSDKHYENKNSSNKRLNFLRPLEDVHFDTRFGNLGTHVISRSTLWTLTLIGVFIMLMACINFINLSTSQAINRSKEIGVRKVLGSRRKDLFWQMMGETGIIVFISLVLSFVLAVICLPFITHIASIPESINIFTADILLFAVLTGVVVTLFAGFYPSLILSGFTPLLALKNKITSASIGGISLRRGLVITQFVISQVLLIGTIVAIMQMDYVHKADLGFNKEAVLVLSGNADSAINAKQASFKQELLRVPGVQSVSYSSDMPSSENNWATNFAFDHKPDAEFSLYLKYADEDYFKTYGLQLLAGSVYAHSDTVRDVVVNETVLKRLGIKNPQDAVGKELRTGRGPWRTVVGVVKDFKTNSLREETKPTMIAPRQRDYYNTSVKINSTNLATTRKQVETLWDKFFPDYAFVSFFMEETIESFYQQESQLSLLYKIFAGIAILISCLGLYGLVSFMAVQRTKEVGVRKVLGASVSNIMYLFSKEFTLLILIAFLLAAPLAWYMMNNWLGNFAYRVSMGAGVFVGAVLLSVFIAWVTVGYKSYKAATANPVKSLRAE
ncbi:MAG: ABC transporter permease [Chitinophagaceae bacterium]|nr:ABC transporter permease [Chitinophagaceae bacterium]